MAKANAHKLIFVSLGLAITLAIFLLIKPSPVSIKNQTSSIIGVISST